MIPKIIHYAWFGNSEIPEKDKKYIETWKKYCPDYEIKLWNEDNYDITKNTYMYEAYKARKWGFVPDYMRLDIVYNYGGFYLDTDVELISSLDSLRSNSCYFGMECELTVNPGLGFGAEKGNPMVKKLRDYYDGKRFINQDGSFNTLPSPRRATEVLLSVGYVQENKIQHLANGVTVYPSDYFCPIDFDTGIETITQNTISIHHYNMSWFDENLRDLHDKRVGLIKKYGVSKGKFVYYIVAVPKCMYRIFRKEGLKGVLSNIKNRLN